MSMERLNEIARVARDAERKAHNRPRNVKARGLRRGLDVEVNKGRDGLWYASAYAKDSNVLLMPSMRGTKTRKASWEFLSTWVDEQ